MSGGAGGIISLICSLGCCAGAITMVVYMGIYAYSNPDPADCFWVEGLTQTSVTSAGATASALASSIVIPEGQPLNVHLVFTTWFAWGFWSCIGPIIAGPVLAIIACLCKNQPMVTGILGGLTGCATCVSFLCWFIFGLIWRWGSMGQASTGAALPERDAASTDEAWDVIVAKEKLDHGLQISSGNFMNVLLILQCISYGITVLGMLCGAVTACMKR